MVGRQLFEPFGGVRAEFGEVDGSWGWATHRKTEATGLTFMRARWYAPGVGRFVSPDSLIQTPYDPQSLNRNAYVRNNPLRHVDPSGHCIGIFAGEDTVAGAIAAAAGPVGWIAVGAVVVLSVVACTVSESCAKAAMTAVEDAQTDVIVAMVPVAMAVSGKTSSNKSIANASANNEATTPGGIDPREKDMAERTAKLNSIRSTYDNITRNSLKTGDLGSARKEMKGEITKLRQDGKPFDHVNKVQEAAKGLNNLLTRVENQLNAQGNTALTETEHAEWLKMRQTILDQLDEISDIINHGK